MNALNEVNKLITGITYYPNRHASIDHDAEEWLTPERMAVRKAIQIVSNSDIMIYF